MKQGSTAGRVAAGRCATGALATWLVLAAGAAFAQPGVISHQEALNAVFAGATIRGDRVYLTAEQAERIAEISREDVRTRIYARYVARRDGVVVGRAYVDTHVVRTKRESLLISIEPDGRVRRIDVTAFLEPPEYVPPRAVEAAVLRAAARGRHRDPPRDPTHRGRDADDPRGQRRGAPRAGPRPGAGGAWTRKGGARRAMTWWERWGFNAFHVIVAVTGTVYLYMKYALTTDDPFAIVNHPWQPTMLSAHVVAAPFFVAFFGMLFRSHSFGKLRSRNPANRRTGWTSVLGFSAMALTGYLIQVATTPALITFFIWTHVAASVVFVIGYGIHLVNGWRLDGIPRKAVRTSPPRPARLSP